MYKSLIYVFFSLIVLFPLVVFNFEKYPIYPIYFITLFPMLVPMIFLRKIYWNAPLTKKIWLLRIIFLFIFIVASFYIDMNFSRFVAFAGFLLLTFYYEIAFLFNLRIEKFFKIFNYVFVLLLIYSYLVIGYFLFKIGHPLFIYHDVRIFLPSFPNYFAIFLLVHYWLRQFFLKKKSSIVDMCIIILIFVSLSRTAIFCLVVSYYTYLFLKRERFKYKLLKGASILLILVPLVVLSLELKNLSPGSTLEHTLISRKFRLLFAFDVFQKHPVFGYGFQSTTALLPEYYSFGGKLALLGSSHNDYMDLLLRSGIVGLLTFLIFIFSMLVKSMKTYKNFSIIIIIMLISALFQNPFKDALLMFYMCFFSAFFTTTSEVAYMKVGEPDKRK